MVRNSSIGGVVVLLGLVVGLCAVGSVGLVEHLIARLVPIVSMCKRGCG